jgi:membrane-bound ClpP family serine protease
MTVEWITVISLVLFGLTLVVAEIIFVPGTTLVGIFGFAFLIAGVGLGFHYFGNTVGWIITGGATFISALVFYFSFKANVWGRFALKSSMEANVNEDELMGLTPGQEGVTLSALRPVGKAEVENKIIEAKTTGGYLSAGTRIRIVKILSNQIIVEPTI